MLQAVSLHILLAHSRSVVVLMFRVIIRIIVRILVEPSLVLVVIIKIFFIQIKSILFEDADWPERLMIVSIVVFVLATAVLTINVHVHPWYPI